MNRTQRVHVGRRILHEIFEVVAGVKISFCPWIRSREPQEPSGQPRMPRHCLLYCRRVGVFLFRPYDLYAGHAVDGRTCDGHRGLTPLTARLTRACAQSRSYRGLARILLRTNGVHPSSDPFAPSACEDQRHRLERVFLAHDLAATSSSRSVDDSSPAARCRERGLATQFTRARDGLSSSMSTSMPKSSSARDSSICHINRVPFAFNN